MLEVTRKLSGANIGLSMDLQVGLAIIYKKDKILFYF